MKFKDGEPCNHPGCLNHVTHPCEGCGRICGKTISDFHPVQKIDIERKVIGKSIVLKAYEVYCHCYGPQIALITGDCRGGFGAGELISFLYAATFPKNEWKDRANEALMNIKRI
jgi:hypothetical protein